MMKYIEKALLVGILISVAIQNHCMDTAAIPEVEGTLQDRTLKELTALKPLLFQNFDGLRLDLVIQQFRGSCFCHYIDADGSFAQDPDRIDDIFSSFVELLQILGERGLFYVLENSELTTSCDGQQLRTKLSLLSKLKLQEIRYLLMKQRQMVQLQKTPNAELCDIFTLKDSVVFWDPDIEKETIKFSLLIKNKIQELIRMACFLAERVVVFNVKLRGVSQSQKKDVSHEKREAKSKLLSVTRLLVSKTLEFLNATLASNIAEVVRRFGLLQGLIKEADDVQADPALAKKEKDDLYRSLPAVCDMVGCLAAYNKLEPLPIDRVPMDIIWYVFSNLMNTPQKPLIHEAAALCKKNRNLADAFNAVLHDYVLEASHSERTYFAKGRMWEMIVAAFLMRGGTSVNKFGRLENMNQHVNLHGRQFSREFDMVTEKLLCECKNIDWYGLSPEKKVKLIAQFKDQAKIAKSKSYATNFFVISKQPVSEEFVEIFRDNAINYVDPRHVGDFKDLFGDAAMMVD